MPQTKFTKLELQIMQALWDHAKISIRENQETIPEPDRTAYTTIQTNVNRLETKKAVRLCQKKSATPTSSNPSPRATPSRAASSTNSWASSEAAANPSWHT